MSPRLGRLNEYLKAQQLDAVIITKPENRRYFSGFSGSAGILLVTLERFYLLTDFRYIEQAQNQTPDFEIMRYSGTHYELLAQLAGSSRLKRIGFEGDHLTFELYRNVVECLRDAELVPIRLDGLRSVKQQEEIILIKKAVEIADSAFSHILAFIKPGIRETDVAAELEHHMRRMGSERPAFDTIVASGHRGALPHGVASEKVIERGELVTLDFGAVYQGYHSDITRTIAVGPVSSQHKDIYNLVLKSQIAGLDALMSGKDCGCVDDAARSVIKEAGYGDYFGHGLGHSVGLAIHEEPRLSPAATGTKLETGMIVTVEPGIYIPGWGGVRIEDLVVVASSGVDVLTASSKALIELD